MKYYKDTNNNLYENPIVENHIGLIEITEAEKDAILAPTAEELQAQQVAYFTDKTTVFIQSRINDYNTANGTAFNNAHNVESYSRTDGYTHQAWCTQLWTWNVNVWEAVRAFQDTLTVAPTDAEFQTVLDSVIF